MLKDVLTALCLIVIFCRSVFMLRYPLRVAGGWLKSSAGNFYRAIGSFPSGNLEAVTARDLILFVRFGGLIGVLVSLGITYALLFGT